MAKNTTQVNCRKTDAQFDYETEEFIIPIRSRVKTKTGRFRNIALPAYIEFRLRPGKELFMHIQEQPAISVDGVAFKYNPTSDSNMQQDPSAFEGWAVCLMAWLPEKIARVCLKWDKPSARNEHYNRFLFRVFRFGQLFDWFSVDEANHSELETFSNNLDNLTINSSGKVPERKSNLENSTEYDFIHTPELASQIKQCDDINNLDHQLPVGVQQKGKQFFTGTRSAIDMWGRNNKTLTVIELKCGNMMVGIITELFFYACVMSAVAKGEIMLGEECHVPYEADLYKHIREIKAINAEMLTDLYHPLVDNEKVTEILNLNHSDTESVHIHFGMTTFSLNRETNELTIPCK